jgi:thiol:disulfide interchange protein DsbC
LDIAMAYQLIILRLLSLVLSLAAFATNAAEPLSTDVALNSFTQKLRVQYPKTKIDSVAKTTVPGLYEVVMGKNVAYVDESGRYFLFGHVWDMQAQKDLTADRKTDLDRVDLGALPKDLALKNVNGNGSREVFVLADPNCHFCRDLEKTLAAMPDTTVYTYMLPILGDDSKRIAEQIWCMGERDRGRAWRDWMTKSVPPAGKLGCDNPMRAIVAIATTLGVNGTPAILSPDGRRHAGAMSEQELASFIAPRGNAVAQGSSVTTKTAQ